MNKISLPFRIKQVCLSIGRKHVESALDFVSSLKLEVTDKKLRNINEG